MIYFRACPKCRGDMKTEEDAFGRFLSCQQCGKLVELRPQVKPIQVNEPQLKLPLQDIA